jgi:hypothetical protein
MKHEARQTFIHEEAKKLREKLGKVSTTISFFIVKEILDRYDNCKINHIKTCEHDWKITNSGYTRDCRKCGEKQ